MFTSCEKDLYDEVIAMQAKKDFHSENFSFATLKKNHPTTAATVLKILSKTNLNNQAKLKDDYNFEIDTTTIIFLQKENGFKSYTFKIKQRKGLNYFRNIVIAEYPDGHT